MPLVPGGTYRAITMQDAVVAQGNGTAIQVCDKTNGSLSTVSLYVSIANTATVTFEGTIDGTTWFSVLGTNITSGATAASTTSSAAFRFTVLGLLKFRARVSAWTSGAVTVEAIAVA